jgi:proteasome beta subunit
METRLLKTGTTTVGIVCKDGVILAADKKATMGNLVSSLGMEKVVIIDDNLAVTTAGLVSDIQLLLKVLRAQVKLEELRRGKPLSSKESASLLAGLVYSNIRKFSTIPGITGFIVGGRDLNGVHLYSMGMDGSMMDVDTFTCDGSGMEFALGVLESQYKQGLSLEEGKKVAIAAVSASMSRDTASGGGIDIVTITKDGVKKVYSQQLRTSWNNQ